MNLSAHDRVIREFTIFDLFLSHFTVQLRNKLYRFDIRSFKREDRYHLSFANIFQDSVYCCSALADDRFDPYLVNYGN